MGDRLGLLSSAWLRCCWHQQKGAVVAAEGEAQSLRVQKVTESILAPCATCCAPYAAEQWQARSWAASAPDQPVARAGGGGLRQGGQGRNARCPAVQRDGCQVEGMQQVQPAGAAGCHVLHLGNVCGRRCGRQGRSARCPQCSTAPSKKGYSRPSLHARRRDARSRSDDPSHTTIVVL